MEGVRISVSVGARARDDLRSHCIAKAMVCRMATGTREHGVAEYSYGNRLALPALRQA